MPPPPPWASLDTNLLHEIFRWLFCVVDRDRVPEVCSNWRAALPRHPPTNFLPHSLRDMPDPLPWLLLPSSDAASSANICCVVDGHALNHRVSVAQGARFFGAYDGGWLFFALEQTHGHALTNLRTCQPELTTRAIPDLLSLRHSPRLENMTMLAATLSAPPDEDICFGAAIVTPWRFVSAPRQVVFWRMGDGVAVDGGQVPHPHPCLHVEDLIYYHGAFYFLTYGEHFRVYKPLLGEDGDINLHEDMIVWFQPRHQEDGEHVLARYLVQSREKLLMVIRFGDPDALLPTKGFKVYETEELEKDGQVFYLWKLLDTLDDRVFFVGRGYSRAFDVRPHMRFGVQEGVYFLDDDCFRDEAMIFEGQDDRAYTCNNNGFWHGPPDNLQPLFQALHPSTSSSPVWVLP